MKFNILKKASIATATLSLVIGSGGGAGTVYYLGRINPDITRPNAFTSLDGARIEKRIEILERRELPPKWLVDEITRLHKELEENKKLVRDFREEQASRTPMIRWVEGRMNK